MKQGGGKKSPKELLEKGARILRLRNKSLKIFALETAANESANGTVNKVRAKALETGYAPSGADRNALAARHLAILCRDYPDLLQRTKGETLEKKLITLTTTWGIKI